MNSFIQGAVSGVYLSTKKKKKKKKTRTYRTSRRRVVKEITWKAKLQMSRG
jgi:hypothetical protein